MKRINIVQRILIVLVLGFIVMALWPRPKYDKENVWRTEDEVLVIAHAGGKGEFPGNTMAAFEHSMEQEVDVLEMDVQITKDGILVLRHGENVTGNIRSMSNCDTVVWKENYEDLKETCNFGYNFQDENGDYPYRDMTSTEWIDAKVYLTTLDELFEAYGDTVLYNIEIKADADAPRTETADELYDLIEYYGLVNHVLVATSFEDISTYLVEQYPDLYISTSHAEAQSMIIHSYTLTGVFYQPNHYSALQIPISFGVPVLQELDLSTKHLISEAHAHNMAVHYWTINDLEMMKFLIRQGADGIITDYPERLQQAIEEVKMEEGTME